MFFLLYIQHHIDVILYYLHLLSLLLLHLIRVLDNLEIDPCLLAGDKEAAGGMSNKGTKGASSSNRCETAGGDSVPEGQRKLFAAAHIEKLLDVVNKSPSCRRS